MRRLAWHKSFRRAFRRVCRKKPELEAKIFLTLERLMADPFDPALKAHKLKGHLEGLWACWVEYDCRVVFTFTGNGESREELIALVDIGTHEEVY